MSSQSLLQVRGLCLDAPGGRPLLRDLTMSLEAGDRVALVGRNGVGKSSLLEVLAGEAPPERGQIQALGRRHRVAQQPAPQREGLGAELGSPGEVRRYALEEARRALPELLLLDEPTRDLDAESVEWLLGWLGVFRGALLVVSHDRRVLRTFSEFFVLAESGGHHFSGSFEALLEELARDEDAQQARYVRHLSRLADKEREHDRLRRRRQRKKNLGRLHELGRSTSRAMLNSNRGYAQQSQGKRSVLQRARIGEAREWALAARRALAVALPLELSLPQLAADPGTPILEADGVAMEAGDRLLFEGISLRVGRERVAIRGPNGAGKTTLLQLLLGERRPTLGSATREPRRLGYIAQNGANWCLEESLIERLSIETEATTIDAAAQALSAHRFPFALAERPLRSLSPGERSRAALICLCLRSPAPELLVLDEPTDHLDFLGVAALQAVLAAWPGGLLLVSHDADFLEGVGVQRYLELGGRRALEPGPGALEPSPGALEPSAQLDASRGLER
ncbi:MAG: ATP-binding cassette domain-containing protein [Myxococcales bacterium]|nr:ATP-binding cassette domain-containing protein [Myxococcales bacterium]